MFRDQNSGEKYYVFFRITQNKSFDTVVSNWHIMDFNLQSVGSLQKGIAASLLVLGGSLVYVLMQRKNDANNLDAPTIPIIENSNDDKRVVLIVGAGTIGSSFAAVFLSQGKKVHVCDPFVTKERLEKRIKENWLSISSRGITDLKEPPLKKALTKTDSLQDALAEIHKQGYIIDFVQEATWEDVDNKQKVLGELDEILDPSILISSSTSFISWTLLVTQCTHKHRVMIGHPTIPHIGCYVEIYGINPDWTNHCKEWYANAAFDVVVMNKTIPGHISNSFLMLNMNHGHDLIRKGVCSPADVHKVLRHLGKVFFGNMYLGLLIAVGGDRGIEGGKELLARVQKDALFLILFSGMKQNTPLPDFVARPVSRLLGQFLEHTLPKPPEEYIQASEDFEHILTENGNIAPQVAWHQINKILYERVCLEVNNDPYGVPEQKYK